MEQRKLLADAAGILLTCVGGTPEAKATCKPEDANKAFENFAQAILRLRVIADPKATKCQGEGASFSLGMLFDSLQGSESAFAANSRTADRVEAEDGSIAAVWWRVQAAALTFQPDPAQMPGIDRIQLLCDELDNGDGLTATNVAKIRAKVCRAKPCSLEDANAFSLDEVADILEAKESSAGNAGQFIERLLSGPDDVELSPRDMALLEAYLRQPVSLATIQQEKKATGHSPTEAARNKLTLIRDFNRGLQGQGDTPEPEKQSDPAPAVVQTEATPTAAPVSNASLALMRVFTNGIADDRIEKATRLLADDKLTANEKLTKIDALIPFPATASAEQLGEMLGVTKQAVLKTDWWMQNRKGEKETEVGRRREGHRKRAQSCEAPGRDNEDE
jgi:hypothetical protein